MSQREQTSACCEEYRRLSRRRFLAAGAGSIAALSSLGLADVPRVFLAPAVDLDSGERDVVVSIFLRGGADALTLCVPFAEDFYYAARPTLAVPRPGTGPGAAIDLDGFFGLAPQMAPLHEPFRRGNLAIVQACGWSENSRSHFDAQRLMETALLGDADVSTGWLGRQVASSNGPDLALRALSVSMGTPRTMVGAPRGLPIPDLYNFDLAGDAATRAERIAVLGDLYTATPTAMKQSGLDSLATLALLTQIDFRGYQPRPGAVYSASALGQQLKSVAALLKAGVRLEAAALDVQGWDTHANQGNDSPTGTLHKLMVDLSTNLAAFYWDMTVGGPPYTAVVMTEFGRNVRQNGSAGTDHGHGGLMMVMGPKVNGGRVIADWPALRADNLFQGQDLQATIDYRDILAEIVQVRLKGTRPDLVFPGFTPRFRGVVRA
jgi:uncharacterized protein (DUF1501 family)